jgi:hypothetical protein
MGGILNQVGGILTTAQSLLGQAPVNTTYSFKDLTGVLANPALGATIQIVGGNIGNGTLTVRMTSERSGLVKGADGTMMPVYKAGDDGEVTIEMQQTSALHHALVSLLNVLLTQAQGGDVSNWASTTLSIRTILDGSGHLCSGVMLQKHPDKPYAVDGQNVTWTLICANVINQ